MGKGEKLATWYNSGNVHKCELQLIILLASSIAWVLSLGFVGGKGKCVLLMKERYVQESQKNCNHMLQYISTRWIPTYETLSHNRKFNRISRNPLILLFSHSYRKGNDHFNVQHHRLVLSIFECDVSGTTSIYFSVPCFVHSGEFLWDFSILLHVGVVHLSSLQLGIPLWEYSNLPIFLNKCEVLSHKSALVHGKFEFYILEQN